MRKNGKLHGYIEATSQDISFATTLVLKVQISPRTTVKDPVKMLEETGTKVSISTVKRVLYQHNLKDRSARKKPLLQN